MRLLRTLRSAIFNREPLSVDSSGCGIIATLRPATKWGRIMKLKTQLLIGLVILAVLDMVIPIPFTALLLLYVLLEKPLWFERWTSQIYKS